MKINFINPFRKAATTYVLCQTNGLGHCVQTIGIFGIPSHEDKTHKPYNSFSKREFFSFFIKLILFTLRQLSEALTGKQNIMYDMRLIATFCT